MPISPFGAAHVAATLAALPGAAIVVIGRRVAASIDRGDDRRRTPLLRGPVHGYSSRLASSGRRCRTRLRPPMTLSDRAMRAESCTFQKRSLPRKANIALLNFSGL